MLSKETKRKLDFADQLQSRHAGADVADPETGEVLISKDDLFTAEAAARLANADNVLEVPVRSPMTCEVAHGCCATCYGIDYSTGKQVDLGMAVGVIAAQALGEPTTQLTLKNKSDARANKADVTQGLPRVQELLEVRIPKARAVLAPEDGDVQVLEQEKGLVLRLACVKKMKKTYTVAKDDEVMVKRGRKVKKGEVLIVRKNKEEVKAIHEGKIEISEDKLMLLIDRNKEYEYEIDTMKDLLVQDGEHVEAGTQLTYGSIFPRELAEVVGIHEAQKYIIDGVQEVYGIQGIAMDDKHLEIIARQMTRYGQITDPGDATEVLPGDYMDVLDIEARNAELAAGEKRQIKFVRLVLGITRASINTESFLAAASFQDQVRVLTEAALIGKKDVLRGLKENVIIGRPVPLGKHGSKRVEEDSMTFNI